MRTNHNVGDKENIDETILEEILAHDPLKQLEENETSKEILEVTDDQLQEIMDGGSRLEIEKKIIENETLIQLYENAIAIQQRQLINNATDVLNKAYEKTKSPTAITKKYLKITHVPDDRHFKFEFDDLTGYYVYHPSRIHDASKERAYLNFTFPKVRGRYFQNGENNTNITRIDAKAAKELQKRYEDVSSVKITFSEKRISHHAALFTTKNSSASTLQEEPPRATKKSRNT